MGEARVPWFGYHPYRPREAAGVIARRLPAAWAILVSFITAFVSVLALVMSVFDVERSRRP